MASRSSGKSSFVFYTDWEAFIEGLGNDKDIADLFKAIVAYASRGELPEELSAGAQMAFLFIKKKIESDTEKWEKTCDSRAEAGKKGALAKNGKCQQNQQELANTANVGKPQQNQQEAASLANPADMICNDNDNDVICNEDIKNITSGNVKGGMGEKTSDPPSHDNAEKKENPKPIKKAFGEYRHVKLSEEQHTKLISDFGEALIAEYIRRCDEYVQSKGPKKAYSDYNLALRQWLKKDGHQPRGQPKEEKYDPYSESIF